MALSRLPPTHHLQYQCNNARVRLLFAIVLYHTFTTVRYVLHVCELTVKLGRRAFMLHRRVRYSIGYLFPLATKLVRTQRNSVTEVPGRPLRPTTTTQNGAFSTNHQSLLLLLSSLGHFCQTNKQEQHTNHKH